MRDRFALQELGGGAWALMALRAGAVAAHFAVMLWLAGWLGLGAFGVLAHHWALALVGSTLLAVGGPMVILRADRETVVGAFLRVGLAQPLGIAGLAMCIVWLADAPAFWFGVVAMALAFGVAQSAASVLRVRGSVSLSMLLRDALPVLVLGAFALGEAAPATMMLQTAVVLAAISLVAVALAARDLPRVWRPVARDDKQASLWLSSLLGMAQAQAELVVAGAFLPPEVFGLYALLRRIANLVALPVSVATWVCAGPVAQAFAQADDHALARAVTRASAIAWYPSLALMLVAMGAGALAGLADVAVLPPEGLAVFAVLLGGAVLQAYWAASYPVANLGPSPVLAVEARALALGLYLLAALAGGAAFGAFGHALAYTLAMTLGSLHLWVRLRGAFRLDTSARVLWRTAGAR